LSEGGGGGALSVPLANPVLGGSPEQLFAKKRGGATGEIFPCDITIIVEKVPKERNAKPHPFFFGGKRDPTIDKEKKSPWRPD